MDKQKVSLITIGIITALSFSSSFAALNIYTNSIESANDAVNAGNYAFNQQGLSSEETSIVSGFGDNMPLDLSLKIIIPSDWNVTLNQAAKKMGVNWQGKATWPYVLENLAKNENLQIDVDWTKRTVNVFSKKAEEQMIAKNNKEIKLATAKKERLEKESRSAAKKALEIRKEVALQEKRLKTEKNKLSKAKHYAGLEQKVIQEYKESHESQKAITINKVFNNANVLPLDRTLDSFVKMTANHSLKEFNEAIYILQKNRMLSENLSDWAASNGWDLKWNADSDFKIVNRVEMKGTLLTSVDKVITLYKNSRKPLMVSFYTKNKVIKVEEFSYGE